MIRSIWWGKRVGMLAGLVEALGLAGTAALIWRNYRSNPGRVIRVRLRGTREDILLRARTSDFHTFCQIFALREYDFENFEDVRQSAFVREAYEEDVRAGGTPLIIDAGGNIGLAAIWFARRFPQARIVSLEPEGANFELLRRNTAGHPNITPLRMALWAEKERVCLRNPGAEPWAFQVGRGPGAGTEVSFEALGVSDILRQEKHERILIAKIDVEGAESEIFAKNTEWIDRARLLIVELHDHLIPFTRTSRSFYRAISGIDAEVVNMGENAFVFTGMPDHREAVACVAGAPATARVPSVAYAAR
ncbi:FkbM family methyltransferase [Roseomonas eburnea]|uniref:FkbM family methyltransferase n=1 Tax=Neoroseomonas eburnea TaxID=1346889 RepID=A0A9X9X699_9PROT|nr:FkbM family methyltransferase [Neoroseomonas eburnea]MBR0679235.1 FkbM family methyltransferase [Neoroseomonas eburnea]